MATVTKRVRSNGQQSKQPRKKKKQKRKKVFDMSRYQQRHIALLVAYHGGDHCNHNCIKVSQLYFHITHSTNAAHNNHLPSLYVKNEINCGCNICIYYEQTNIHMENAIHTHGHANKQEARTHARTHARTRHTRTISLVSSLLSIFTANYSGLAYQKDTENTIEYHLFAGNHYMIYELINGNKYMICHSNIDPSYASRSRQYCRCYQIAFPLNDCLIFMRA